MSDQDSESTSAVPEASQKASTGNGDPVMEKIEFTATSQNPFLNISQLKAKVVPDALLNLTHLQFLYLSFNNLEDLPQDFFSALPNLKWLDLRVNQLHSLPIVDLSCHAFLEYLLIEDNCISQLPIELGYVKSLRGLALSGNPLDFPHAEVVAAGVQAVKAYLREVHDGRAEIEGRLAAENSGVWEGDAGDYEDDDDRAEAAEESAALEVSDSGGLSAQILQHQRQQQRRQLQSDELTAQTVQLHRPQAPQIRQRVRPQPPQPPRHQPLAALARQSDRHSQLVRQFPEPPGPGLAERHAAEERRNARRRETLNRQEAVLQRRRDAEATRQWREESKKLQMARAHEQLVKGPLAVTRDSETRIRAAPFNAGWESSLMELPTQADVDRQRWEGGGVKPEPRPEPLSPEAQVQLERQRRHREAEIAQQVQLHTAALMERRRQAGQLTATQAVEAARRDVEIAMNMQRELALRRAQLENRTLALQPDALLQGGGGRRRQRQPARK